MGSRKKKGRKKWPDRKIPKCIEEPGSNCVKQKGSEDVAYELEQKLLQVADATPQERFAVFSACFEQVIAEHCSFAPLLSEIKHEYEGCIDTVLRGGKEASFLYRNLSHGISGEATLEHYRHRIQDLTDKIRAVYKSNFNLKKELSRYQNTKNNQNLTPREELKKRISMLNSKYNTKRLSCFETASNKEFRLKILNMYTTNEQTNLAFLDKELLRLKREIEQLNTFFDRKFKLRVTRDRLVDKLLEKEKQKADLLEKWENLKENLLEMETKLKERKRNQQVVSKRSKMNFFDLILNAIRGGEDPTTLVTFPDGSRRSGSKNHQPTTSSSLSPMEDDDPLLDEECHDEMMQYMELFEDLFLQKNFEDAALVAATSPHGILMTTQNFERFKLATGAPGELSPLLQLCEAVVLHCNKSNEKGLSAVESADAVDRALYERRFDFVVQWVSQNKLKYSEALGDVIIKYCNCVLLCRCGCCTFAEVVYRAMKAHEKVVTCLYRQGRFFTAIHYARNKAKFKKLDFMKALTKYACVDHALALLQVGDGYLSSPLCREECLYSLVKAEEYEEAIKLIESYRQRIRMSKMSTYINKNDWKEWEEFSKVLYQHGYTAAFYDSSAILVLITIYCGANMNKLL